MPLTTMNPRAFLVRGLVAGLLAGLAAFAVGFVVGEPQVDRAIAVEESAHEGHAHSHDEPEVVSRGDQSTWGLATGTVTIGVAVGGVLALAGAGAMGRIGRLSPTASTTLVSAIGYASFVVVPFLKYPASPPAVGSPETIGQRTALYFIFVAISLLAATGCVVVATKIVPRLGFQNAALTGVGAYLAVVIVAALGMPTVDEVGDFPGDVLWNFRVASLLTQTTLWAVAGTVLVALIGRLSAAERAESARREFAASL